MEMEMQESDGLEGAREKRDLQQGLRGLFCCFFRQLGDEQRTRKGGDVATGEQGVRITVENPGRVNVGFSLLDEEPPKRRASPLRICTPALRKKRAKPPRSLSQDVLLIGSSGDDGDEEEENQVENGSLLTGSAEACALLARPALHLIPPTPSFVAGEVEFFNVSLTNVGRQGRECAEKAPVDEAGESERDPQKEGGRKFRFSRRCQQGASLAENPRKSESAPPVPAHQSCISVLFATQRLPTPPES